MTDARASSALTRAQVREVDRRAIEELGIPGIVLMENASAGAARWLCASLSEEGADGPVVVLCGGGNNGGDGYAIARHVANVDRAVACFALTPSADLPPDARTNRAICERMGVPVADVGPPDATALAELDRAVVVVEALLGTGARGAPREPAAAWIRAANERARLRFAVDLPAGLDADTGVPAEPTLCADWTATFVAPKVGFANPAARPLLGTVEVVPIGVPARLIRAVRGPS